MKQNSESVWIDMRQFACKRIAYAMNLYFFIEGDEMTLFAAPHIALCAQLIIMARIVQEHPVLVFDSIPTINILKTTRKTLDLFDYGAPKHYQDLPEALWIATGYEMRDREHFLKFCHLCQPLSLFRQDTGNLSDATTDFVFEVIDPMLDDFWQMSICSYLADENEEFFDRGHLDCITKGLEITKRTHDLIILQRALRDV